MFLLTYMMLLTCVLILCVCVLCVCVCLCVCGVPTWKEKRAMNDGRKTGFAQHESFHSNDTVRRCHSSGSGDCVLGQHHVMFLLVQDIMKFTKTNTMASCMLLPTMSEPSSILEYRGTKALFFSMRYAPHEYVKC